MFCIYRLFLLVPLISRAWGLIDPSASLDTEGVGDVDLGDAIARLFVDTTYNNRAVPLYYRHRVFKDEVPQESFRPKPNQVLGQNGLANQPQNQAAFKESWTLLELLLKGGGYFDGHRLIGFQVPIGFGDWTEDRRSILVRELRFEAERMQNPELAAFVERIGEPLVYATRSYTTGQERMISEIGRGNHPGVDAPLEHAV